MNATGTDRVRSSSQWIAVGAGAVAAAWAAYAVATGAPPEGTPMSVVLGAVLRGAYIASPVGIVLPHRRAGAWTPLLLAGLHAAAGLLVAPDLSASALPTTLPLVLAAAFLRLGALEAAEGHQRV